VGVWSGGIAARATPRPPCERGTQALATAEDEFTQRLEAGFESGFTFPDRFGGLSQEVGERALDMAGEVVVVIREVHASIVAGDGVSYSVRVSRWTSRVRACVISALNVWARRPVVRRVACPW